MSEPTKDNRYYRATKTSNEMRARRKKVQAGVCPDCGAQLEKILERKVHPSHVQDEAGRVCANTCCDFAMYLHQYNEPALRTDAKTLLLFDTEAAPVSNKDRSHHR